MLTAYKNLNNVSEELLKTIPPMADEVVFQMLNGHPNNDMDYREREKEPILYGKTQIPTFARIKDPKTGGIVDIGVPQVVEQGYVKSFKPFLTGNYDGKFNGKFSLMKGRIEDEELYPIFFLLNENESNPNRDSSVAPLFKIVDHKKEVQNTVTKIDTLRNALEDLKELTKDEILAFAASQNWTETNPDFLKAKVSEFAKSYPDKYLAIRKDPNTNKKSKIKEAISKNVLQFDIVKGDVVMNGAVLLTVPKEKINDHLDIIVNWLNAAKKGAEVYDGIIKQLG